MPELAMPKPLPIGASLWQRVRAARDSTLGLWNKAGRARPLAGDARIEPAGLITLRPRHGMPMRLERRKT